MNNNHHQDIHQEYSAGVVLFKDDKGKRKYLILQYPGGHFDFPKGHLEAGESEQEAARRELEEETGVQTDYLYEGFQEVITYDFHRRTTVVQKTVTFFLARTDHRQIKISHEHRGYLWLDYENALAKITFENAKSLLRKSEEFLKIKSTTNEKPL